jgi:nitrate/nitrite transporter NarK
MRLVATLLAGSIWGLCNGALAMVLAFGPTVLTGRGASLAEASATTSLVLWLAAISLPAGGMIGDRLGRPDAVLLAGCAGFAAALALALASPGVAVFVLPGLMCGLPAGPIMALPGRGCGRVGRCRLRAWHRHACGSDRLPWGVPAHHRSAAGTGLIRRDGQPGDPENGALRRTASCGRGHRHGGWRG